MKHNVEKGINQLHFLVDWFYFQSPLLFAHVFSLLHQEFAPSPLIVVSELSLYFQPMRYKCCSVFGETFFPDHHHFISLQFPLSGWPSSPALQHFEPYVQHPLYLPASFSLNFQLYLSFHTIISRT